MMLVVDPKNYTIVERSFEEPLEMREGMYLKAIGNPLPEQDGMLIAAFVFPLECRERIQKLFAELEKKEKEFREFEGHILYHELSGLRPLYPFKKK